MKCVKVLVMNVDLIATRICPNTLAVVNCIMKQQGLKKNKMAWDYQTKKQVCNFCRQKTTFAPPPQKKKNNNNKIKKKLTSLLTSYYNYM